MTTTTTISGKTITLRPFGRFDAHAIGGFNEIIAGLRSPMGNQVLLDMTDVEFVDEPALDALIRLRTDLRNSNGELVVESISQVVRIILRLTGRDADLGLPAVDGADRTMALAV